MKEYRLAKKVLSKTFPLEGKIAEGVITELASCYTGLRAEGRRTKKGAEFLKEIRPRTIAEDYKLFEAAESDGIDKIMQDHAKTQRKENLEMSYHLYGVVEALFNDGRYFCREQPEAQYEKEMMVEPVWQGGTTVRSLINVPRRREVTHSRMVGHTLGIDLELPGKLVRGYLVLMDVPEHKRKYEQMAVIRPTEWIAPMNHDWNMYVLSLSESAEAPIIMSTLALPGLRMGKGKNLTEEDAVKTLKGELLLD